MKEISLKLRYIYGRYLLIGIGFIICYSIFRWYFDYKLGVLHLKEDLLDFWIPFALPWIPILIWLRRRVRFLKVRGKRDNGFFFYQFIAVASISAPTIVTQGYIEASSSQLIQVNSPYEITGASNIDCYKITDFNIIKEYAGAHRASRTSGRHNDKLNFTTYFIVPLVDHNQQVDLTNHKYWYGFKFTESMSNHASDEKKNARWREFYEECIKKYEQYNYTDYQYLQGLAYSDDRDGYIEAVKARQKNNSAEDLIILEPINESFADKAGNKFAWIFGSFGIGAFIFLLMVLIPSIDYAEFRRYTDKRPLQDDDLKDVLKFLVPKGDHFTTAILINANLIVFVFLVFSGINIISATPKELLDLGANRRHEVLNGESWRLFTSMFLHGGLMHVMMNLFGIGATCASIEPILGRTRTLMAYILSGIGASLVSIYWHENTISVGASGAIFGMMGVMIALLLTKKDGGFGGAYLIILGLYGGVSLLFGLLGGIDNAAHIGGLLTGIVIGLILILTNLKRITQVNRVDR
jgi:rhomboid protease GluP